MNHLDETVVGSALSDEAHTPIVGVRSVGVTEYGQAFVGASATLSGAEVRGRGEARGRSEQARVGREEPVLAKAPSEGERNATVELSAEVLADARRHSRGAIVKKLLKHPLAPLWLTILVGLSLGAALSLVFAVQVDRTAGAPGASQLSAPSQQQEVPISADFPHKPAPQDGLEASAVKGEALEHEERTGQRASVLAREAAVLFAQALSGVTTECPRLVGIHKRLVDANDDLTSRFFLDQARSLCRPAEPTDDSKSSDREVPPGERHLTLDVARADGLPVDAVRGLVMRGQELERVVLFDGQVELQLPRDRTTRSLSIQCPEGFSGADLTRPLLPSAPTRLSLRFQCELKEPQLGLVVLTEGEADVAVAVEGERLGTTSAGVLQITLPLPKEHRMALVFTSEDQQYEVEAPERVASFTEASPVALVVVRTKPVPKPKKRAKKSPVARPYRL